nr:hypothetical protein [uncultured Arsenicibacter sp.]
MTTLHQLMNQYRAYLDRGLGPQDSRFWWIFGSCVLLSCTCYYFYSNYAEPAIHPGRSFDDLITLSFSLLPAFTLRRLQYFIPMVSLAIYTEYWWLFMLYAFLLYDRKANRPA